MAWILLQKIQKTARDADYSLGYAAGKIVGTIACNKGREVMISSNVN
jgi:hypothetical protein